MDGRDVGVLFVKAVSGGFLLFASSIMEREGIAEYPVFLAAGFATLAAAMVFMVMSIPDTSPAPAPGRSLVELQKDLAKSVPEKSMSQKSAAKPAPEDIALQEDVAKFIRCIHEGGQCEIRGYTITGGNEVGVRSPRGIVYKFAVSRELKPRFTGKNTSVVYDARDFDVALNTIGIFSHRWIGYADGGILALGRHGELLYLDYGLTHLVFTPIVPEQVTATKTVD